MEGTNSTVTGNEGQAGGVENADGQGRTGTDGQKLFTQEEVNSFVQSRISRYKAQADRENQAAYSRKMAELQQREMRILVKEQLSARDMPKELADVITCTDEADLKDKLDALQKIYGSSAAGKGKEPTGFIQVGTYGGGGGIPQGPDPIRRAMGLGKG